MREVQVAQNAAKESEQNRQNFEQQFNQFNIEHMRLKEQYDKLVESEQSFKELNEKYRKNFLTQVDQGETKSPE